MAKTATETKSILSSDQQSMCMKILALVSRLKSYTNMLDSKCQDLCNMVPTFEATVNGCR